MVSILCHDLTANGAEPPDGEILFYREIRQGKGDLFVIDIKSGRQIRVGQSGSRSDHFPSWSANGRKIVFESYRKSGWHIWVSDADGNNARRLTDQRDYEFDPAFAPDNQTVIFKQGDDLWTVTLNNPTPERITPENNNLSEAAPAYSPDGKKIVFMGQGNRDKTWHIYTINSDGSGLVRLTKGQSRNLSPVWSPDGRHILFYSDRSGSYELYEMTDEGMGIHPIFNQTQLKSTGFQNTAFINPWDNNWGATEQYRADYSPDGDWIVFSRNVGGDRELFVAQRDGSDITRLTQRKGLDGQPAWRPK